MIIDNKECDLITNFELNRKPLVEISVKASGLKYTIFGPAFDVLGNILKDHEGLYIEKAHHEEMKKETELSFHAYFYACDELKRVV